MLAAEREWAELRSPPWPREAATHLFCPPPLPLQFFIVLLIILLAELILLILFFVYTDEVSNNAKQDLKEGLVLYNTDNNAGLKDAWNTIQGEVCVCVCVTHCDSGAPAALILGFFPTLLSGGLPSVAVLRRDGPQRLVLGHVRERGPRPLLPAVLPGLRTQHIQHLLDQGTVRL